MIERMDGKTLDMVQENIEVLKQLFPECVTENKVDFERLRQVLGEQVEDGKERYEFTWPGKKDCISLAQQQSTGTLRPDKESSKNWDSTKNLYIEGDNLEVLRLLQKSYHRKVKMIYIDPPYNTGNDFIYKDDFKDNIKNYLSKTDQSLTSNPETSGRYHSDWLNMMYPRLMLARNLLSDDGLIFISIDDNEVANLRKMCDEIFGEENFLITAVWEKRYTRSNNAKLFATLSEYVLIYRKSEALTTLREPRNEKADSIYDNPDNDPRGPWTSVSYVNPATKEQRPNLVYTIHNPVTSAEINHPTNAWKYEHERHLQHCAENRLWWGKNGENTYPRLKRFLSEMDGNMVAVNLWKREEAGTTDEGSKQLEELFGCKVFDFPKPTKLVEKMVRLASSMEDDIVLDFFAGTSTTAHAVWNQVLQQGINRRYILVQIPEPINMQEYQTIAQISKERIRRAGQMILDENAGMEGIENLDIGFRAFKLDSSSLLPWDPDAEDISSALEALIDPVKDGRTVEDVLFEIMIKYGIDLAMPIEEVKLGGKTCYSVGKGYMIVCLDQRITLDVVEAIAARKPARVVFKDMGFADDNVKTNAVQILKKHGIEDFRSI